MMTTHPFRVGRASTGLGLFATEIIDKGKFIVEYTGRRITWQEAETAEKSGGRYMFELNNRWTIDGSARSNIARYLNHACRPNAEAYEVRGKIKIYARRRIKPEEHITIDYGKDYFDLFIAPIGCKCPKCLDGGAAKGRRAK